MRRDDAAFNAFGIFVAVAVLSTVAHPNPLWPGWYTVTFAAFACVGSGGVAVLYARGGGAAAPRDM